MHNKTRPGLTQNWCKCYHYIPKMCRQREKGTRWMKWWSRCMRITLPHFYDWTDFFASIDAAKCPQLQNPFEFFGRDAFSVYYFVRTNYNYWWHSKFDSTMLEPFVVATFCSNDWNKADQLNYWNWFLLRVIRWKCS